MEHTHSHSYAHHHGPADYNRAFAIGVVLNVGFVIAEVVFGLVADSLALLADAGHNLSDVLGLLLAWGAAVLAQRKASERRTYGLRKTTILAALANALILLVAIGGIAWEAIQRFSAPAAVGGTVVIGVALVGVLINTMTALLFVTGHKEDLNLRGAFLHMAADAAVSLGVVVAGVLIVLTGWAWIDPLVSLVIALVILVGSWGLLKDSVNLAMDAVPEGIELQEIEAYLQSLPGVVAVHDLHVWGLSTTETALTAHLLKPDPEGDDVLLERAATELEKRFRIVHTTIQLERDAERCPQRRHCGPDGCSQ